MCLGMVKKDYISYLEYWYKNDKLVAVHDRNIRSLAVELFKVKQKFSNPMLCDIFLTWSLRYKLETKTEFLKTVLVPPANTIWFLSYALPWKCGRWFHCKIKIQVLSKVSVKKSESGSNVTVTVTPVNHTDII